MKRLLTAGIFGTILGIVGTSAVNASIVSSGFLDEKLTEYALSTALDLKANQTDLTALSNKIGNDWPYYGDLLTLLTEGLFPPEITLANASDLAKLLIGGQMESGINTGGVLNRFAYTAIIEGEHDPRTGTRSDGFRSLSQLTNGWTDKNDGTTYLGVKDINTKIGTLPTETAMSSCSVWRAIDLTQNEMPNTIGGILDQLYNSGHTSGSCQHDGYNGPSLPNIIRRLIFGYNYDQGTTKMMGINPLNVGETDGKGNIIRPGLNQITNGWAGTDGTTYLGIKDINTKIGTLPDGKTVAGMIKETDGKIGELPTEIPNMDSTWAKYGFVDIPGTPIDLPDTVGGMLSMLFNEDGKFTGLSLRNIMAKILMGFVTNTGARIEGLSHLTNAYNLQGDSPLVNAVNANTAKIGTLPSEYSTVGAALTAIKGIAEEAKAAALAAIPDPKQEGSSGKFVLTVDIVGDNATYRWEKIDREGETTTISE